MTRKIANSHKSACKDFSKVKWRRRGKRAGRCEALKMKVKKLQRLIPGGEGLQPDRLLLRTADYILHLRFQLNVLQALSKIYRACPDQQT